MSSPLCLITRSSTGSPPETICEISFEKTTALVAALIGALFIATSLYLFLGGVGTIPCITSASGLLGAGLLITALSIVFYFKHA